MENVALNSVSCIDTTKTGLISCISWEKTISSSNVHFTPLKMPVTEHPITSSPNSVNLSEQFLSH